MRAKALLVVVALILSSILAPLFVTNVQAADCPSNCYLEATTNVPASGGTVRVRLDGGTTYALNYTFTFVYDSSHTLEVVDTLIDAPSGIRYIFKQWSHNGIPQSSTPALSGNPPFPIRANYTTGYNGPLVAEFEEHYDATVRVVDRDNKPIAGVSLSITLANATTVAFTTGSQGEVHLGYIPLGTYTVRVFFQNRDMGLWALDASVGPVDTIKLDVDSTTAGPTVSSLVLFTFLGLALFMILLAINFRRSPRPPVI